MPRLACLLALAAARAAVPPEALAAFRRDGYHAAPGLLAAEAEPLKREMAQLMNDARENETATWDGHGAKHYTVTYQPDAATGLPIPGRVFKIQGVATRSAAVRDVLRHPKIVDVVSALMGLRADEALDAFGSKFFPLLPVNNGTRSTSVDWHDDVHYFGTVSPRVVSMSMYLEDTTLETGCLQIVPGSHVAYADGAAREARYARGLGDQSHGEWLELDASEMPVDIPVPAGTPVFFDGRLVHGARPNNHPTRSSFRIIAHFVPADLEMSWRGVDFGRGRYADRYIVRGALTTGEL